MSKELSRLRGVRRAYKGHVTQDINKAERLMSAEDDELAELTAIFKRISRRENEITALDSSIVHLLESEDEIARDVEETLTLQDKVSVTKTRITKYIQNKNPPVRSNQHASHAPSTSKKHVNLPKMTLKTYSPKLFYFFFYLINKTLRGTRCDNFLYFTPFNKKASLGRQ